MDRSLDQNGETSLWARALELAKQSDAREQPWKAALAIETKAKENDTYDQLPDKSKEYWEDGSGGDGGDIRPCTH
ncbi:uncharacterized protein N7529_009460 [Penicillium soppii]|jgi:hypothetical protein|uniref:uncharacterized protein n=1 Tax=Penicillium soppii TaxID=69789 RepID=UPI00254674E8|nr:uncharacterized protein N7529_009460 [Penicillium soppii]KAJ5855516.1 hypothetical protein N7529_009460 [Penicillium soppii]